MSIQIRNDALRRKHVKEAAPAITVLLATAQVEDASALLWKLLGNGVLSVTALAALSAAELQSQYGVAAAQAEGLAAAAKEEAAMVGEGVAEAATARVA